MPPRILLSSPHLGLDERVFVQEAFDTNWIAPVGPHIPAFEQEFCQVVGSPHAAALSSGTAALHLALRLIGLQPGDEVICSTLTFIATASPITFLGASPVFIDCEPQSWNLDPHLLEDELRRRAQLGTLPKAVLLVHLYGQSADLDPILALCNRYEIPLIEDAAEALGATYKGKAPGTLGRIGIYSFNGNKIITTSGGGALLSSNAEWIQKARFLATQARDAAPHYQHSSIGYNYRMSNVLAGIGRGQMQVLNDRVQARRRNFEYYQANLGDLPGIGWQPESEGSFSNRWLTCLTLDPTVSGGLTREDLRLELEKDNIESRPLWKPMHLQPVFVDAPFYGDGMSQKLFEQGLCLPAGSNLTQEDLDRVIQRIRSLFGV